MALGTPVAAEVGLHGLGSRSQSRDLNSLGSRIEISTLHGIPDFMSREFRYIGAMHLVIREIVARFTSTLSEIEISSHASWINSGPVAYRHCEAFYPIRRFFETCSKDIGHNIPQYTQYIKGYLLIIHTNEK